MFLNSIEEEVPISMVLVAPGTILPPFDIVSLGVPDAEAVKISPAKVWFIMAAALPPTAPATWRLADGVAVPMPRVPAK